MSLAIIVGLPLLAGFGLLYWADQIREGSPLLALVFQLMFLPSVWLSITFGVEYLALVYGSASDMTVTLAEFASYLGWILFLIGLILLYGIVKEIVSWFNKKKQKKQEELYG